MQPKSTNLSNRPVKQRNTLSVEVSVLLHVHSWPFCFKDNVNEWVTFACDGTGPADESKRTKRVQRWSRLNWLGGILIIVSWHIHFNKLLMPLKPVCCFANRCKVYNFHIFAYNFQIYGFLFVKKKSSNFTILPLKLAEKTANVTKSDSLFSMM